MTPGGRFATLRASSHLSFHCYFLERVGHAALPPSFLHYVPVLLPGDYTGQFASLIDTMSLTGSSQKTLTAISPPRETMRLAQATERIKPGDMLQFRLPDEPAAAINGLYQVAADGTIHLAGEGPSGGRQDARRGPPGVRDVLSLAYAVQRLS